MYVIGHSIDPSFSLLLLTIKAAAITTIDITTTAKRTQDNSIPVSSVSFCSRSISLLKASIWSCSKSISLSKVSVSKYFIEGKINDDQFDKLSMRHDDLIDIAKRQPRKNCMPA
jgi:hypothetical protein